MCGFVATRSSSCGVGPIPISTTSTPEAASVRTASTSKRIESAPTYTARGPGIAARSAGSGRASTAGWCQWMIDAVADVAGVRHVVDRPFRQATDDVAGRNQLTAHLLEHALVRRHHVPLRELVVGHKHGSRAHRRELVVQPPVRVRDPEVQQHRIVQLGKLYHAARDLLGTARRAAAAAEHKQAAVVASTELGLARSGQERLYIGDAPRGGGAHERVGDRLAGAAELAVVVLEPGDDDVGSAHGQAASGSVASSRSAAHRSTATIAAATTWSMFRYW